jgi:hypothetical protein
MFISKAELEKIRSQIKFLQDLACKHQSEINEIKWPKEKVSAPAKVAGKHKNPRSAESRAIQSKKMKAAWVARKARALTA